ncbi:3-deoxy-manno-octulosonate cytidylyltransferase [Pseudoalteromonas ruthenica]|uniref:3-deoxy-manno-octulosonate cytidylyltransferase n=1 Tax=Pseudoalteromonas ruthenica TaxID=151081 RepID=UPI001107BC87|nr:3-deoxy-manno-octulosonate cytidylyltransferase [Pseudoalteromonas ruthenica]TLX49452.1 3-deoxy-manno-octulosonate cytidylyltransferase [Pseudoalteromonas ruthenica]
MEFVVIIPARYASTRLPGKPLADIAGKPMIQHVYERAVLSGATAVYVATDHVDVATVCEGFGAPVVMTREDHQSGTERLAEVVAKLALDDDTLVVNVQGDEPLLAPENVAQVAQLLSGNDAPMATLSTAIIDREEALNPNAVKVVSNTAQQALYFSRAPIPYHRDALLTKSCELDIRHMQRHIGIYAYRAGFINEYIGLAPSPLEQLESLEQLRVLYHGFTINMAEAKQVPAAGVDTEEDLARVISALQ